LKKSTFIFLDFSIFQFSNPSNQSRQSIATINRDNPSKSIPINRDNQSIQSMPRWRSARPGQAVRLRVAERLSKPCAYGGGTLRKCGHGHETWSRSRTWSRID
jgi:hypothetical protein